MRAGARAAPEGDRQARGTVIFNLGVCFKRRIAGDTVDNADRALSSFQEALGMRDRETEAMEWARVQNAVGVAWQERRAGDPAENKREAIRALQSALDVRRELGDGDYLASTLTNLANVRVSIGGEERSANLEQAIAEYREALALLDPANLETRGAVLINLATSLLDLPGPDRAGNIDAAIAAVEEALPLRADDHELHAAKLILANALGLKLTGVKSQSLERAIALVDEVIAYRLEHESAERQASAYNSRGILYARRIRGGRAENIEQALISYRRALAVYTAEAYPADRAGTLNNLASVLRARPLGEKAANEHEAIAALTEALGIYTRETDPYLWAGTMSNLGTAYFERTTGDRNDHIDSAIAAYLAALEVRREETLPWEWAQTQFNLGQAFWRRYRDDRVANLNAALDALAATLRVRTRDRHPDEWAGTQSMLAVVYDELAELGELDNDAPLEAYEAALSVYQPDTFPSEARANANNLAGLLLRTDQAEKALDAAGIGLRAAELLYAAAATEEGREHELDENARLYRLATEAALDAGRPASEVFELGEAGRGRLLGDWLSAADLTAPPRIPKHLITEEARARAGLRESLIEARQAASDEQRTLAARRAAGSRRDLERLWGEMETHPDAAAFLAERRGAGLTAKRMQAWLDGQPGRAAIIVISAIRDRPIAFTAVACVDGPEVVRYSTTHEKVNELLARVDHELIAADAPARHETWTEIGEWLMAPALERLDTEITLLYVIPLGGLHAVPWHASFVEKEPLLERFPVVYAPSASAAVRLARPENRAPMPDHRTVVIGDPDQTLRYARREAEAVAAQLGVTPLLGSAATVADTRRALRTTHWAHLAAHGHYHHDDPLASGVALTDGVLAARDLLGGFAPRTMVLSACETGRQAATAGDELWGLARALLYAGTQTGVVSLWRVLDRTTERVMSRFYAELLTPSEPAAAPIAAALRRAMLTTREDDPRAFFWAPFTLLGNPY